VRFFFSSAERAETEEVEGEEPRITERSMTAIVQKNAAVVNKEGLARSICFC